MRNFCSLVLLPRWILSGEKKRENIAIKNTREFARKSFPILPALERPKFHLQQTRKIKKAMPRLCRSLSIARTAFASKRAAVFRSFGNPGQVLRVEDIPQPAELAPGQVAVRFLASPINPADLNTVEGVYPIKPSAFPAIGGNEGVAEVLEVADGPNIPREFEPGDLVVPAAPGLVGTWQNFCIAQMQDFQRVNSKAGVENLATIAVNPCTAFRLLQDFGAHKSVVQNAGNSGVGLMVGQIGRILGIKVISIIRERNSTDETRQLKDFIYESKAADLVLTESEFASKDWQAQIRSQGIERPTLGLNAVGGTSSSALAKSLESEGTMVTYGGMSMRPVTIPTGLLIFKNIRVEGFWLSRWVKQHSREERQNMLDRIADWMAEGKISGNFVKIPFTEFPKALELSRSPFKKGKVLLTFEESEN